jgi:hypothetical protein
MKEGREGGRERRERQKRREGRGKGKEKEKNLKTWGKYIQDTFKVIGIVPWLRQSEY